MAAISPVKVSGNGNNGFSKTLMFEVLACGNIEGNNNKFYCIEMQENPSTGEFRLFTHYGRIGKTNVYEVRDNIHGVKVTKDDKAILEKEYHSILKKKKRVSKSKSVYETVDTQKPSVGSENIRDTTVTTSTAKSKGELSIIKKFSDQQIKALLRKIWEENVHSITNLTTMTVSSSGISSPLGPLTLSHIERAGTVLDNVKNAYNGGGNVADLNAQYYSMIPHPFGNHIPSDAMIDNDTKFLGEYDLLEQLRSAIQVGGTNEEKEEKEIDIPFDIRVLSEQSRTRQGLTKMYIDSRASCHRHLSGWNVSNVFELDHRQSTENYKRLDERFKADEFELFHGTKSCNLLSIMMNGFMIPPSTAGHVTGRLYGNGLYFASASSKALNYATGYWGGLKNKHPEAYMFVAQVAMGKMYHPTRHMYNGAPDGYDSIWSKKESSSLVNDEMIVYRLDQAKITHILELKNGR